MSTEKHISDGAIKRLGRIVGVNRMTAKIPDEVRRLVYQYLEEIIKKVSAYLTYNNKKIVKQGMVSESLDLKGVVSDKQGDKCSAKNFKLKVIPPSKYMTLPRGHYDCLMFARAPFVRLCRELMNKYVEDSRFSKESLVLLQYSIESYVINLLGGAHVIAHNAKRLTVNHHDLRLAQKFFDIY